MSVNGAVVTQEEQFLLSQTSQESWKNIGLFGFLFDG